MCRVLDDRDNTLQFVGIEISGSNGYIRLYMDNVSWEDIPFIEINIGFLADQVGVPTTNTLDLSQSVHDFSFAIDVSVEKTENVLQFVNLSICARRRQE